jgi:hypothetical protein
MSRKRKKLQGTVQKVIKPAIPSQPEKAEIDIHGADDLYREIRIENVVTDEKGEKAQLKAGAEVAVCSKPVELGEIRTPVPVAAS